MNIQNSVILFTNNITNFNILQNYCNEEIVNFYYTDNVADVIDKVFHLRYDVLIIDEKCFPTKSHLIELFSKENFYVPNIVYFGKKSEENYLHITSCKELIGYLNKIFKNKREIQPYINLDYYTKITDIINHLGFSMKYKGYKYLIDILNRMLLNNYSYVSFKKYIYPTIASYYSVSVDSIERDVRNILLKAVNNKHFKETIDFDENITRFTTRNIINSLLIYIKKNLYNNKYSKVYA